MSSRFFRFASLEFVSFKFALLLVALLYGATHCRAATVLRTLTYHQVTDNTTFDTTPIAPILSANGNRAAFTLPPAPGGTTNRICAINPDGTGFQVVDSYAPFCFCSSVSDISADGSKIVSTDSVQIRIANGNGSGATPLIALDSNEINDLAISGDGTKVFFRIYRSTSIRGTNPAIPIENGIYVINANGSGLRQIVGPSQLAALLGRPATDFAFFGNNSSFTTLRSSNDGGRLVFGSMVAPGSGGAGQRLFGVNLNGSGLRDYFGQQDWIYQATISADGTKVGYALRPIGGPNDEAGTVNFDGSGRLKLVDSTQRLPGTGGSFYLSRLQLTSNGAKLLITDSGMLFNTDGSGAVPLGLASGNVASNMVYDGLVESTMNATASKFLYLFLPAGQSQHVFATLDINSAAAGNAPSLTQPVADPTFVLLNGASTATLSARASGSVTQVGSRVVGQNGLPDDNVTSAALLDNATNGDATAGDGVFATNTLAANCCATLGAHSVRLKAEIADANARLHATAIDFEPLTVSNTPPPPPGVSVSNVSVTEGNAGTVNLSFTVSLSIAAFATGTIDYATADDSAVAPGDYTAKSGTLTFAPGDTSKTVNIAVKGDTLNETNEQLALNLSNPVNLSIIDGQGLGTIANDDAVPNISINDVAVLEGNSGTSTASFTVSLSSASGRSISVKYQTSVGTANAPADYAAALLNSLTFSPGETTRTINIIVNGDLLDEDNETFFVNLSEPIRAAFGDNQGIGTITDDDATPTLAVSNAATKAEGSAATPGSTTFTVTLSAPSGKSVSVNYQTTDNAALAGQDYVAKTGTLTFAPGETVKFVRVDFIGDAVAELNEPFFLDLRTPANATIADSRGSAYIRNDDGPSLVINNAVTVNEGNLGTVAQSFTVTLSAASTNTVTVAYATANGTAGPADYTVQSGTLSFAPGQTSKVITILVKGDTIVEPTETYRVNLSNPTFALLADSQGVGYIRNDDVSAITSDDDAPSE